MSAHTPGPWRAVRNEVHAGRRRICSHVTAGESLPIGDDFQRACANARLIAAAPELLAALRECLRGMNEQRFSEARAAIAKATGEQA